MFESTPQRHTVAVTDVDKDVPKQSDVYMAEKQCGKFTSHTQCCEYGVAGDCSQETTADASCRCSRTSCAFGCGVDTPCIMPVAVPRQTPVIQRDRKTVEMPVVQFSDGAVDMPVVTQRQVPMIPKRAADCGGAADPVR